MDVGWFYSNFNPLTISGASNYVQRGLIQDLRCDGRTVHARVMSGDSGYNKVVLRWNGSQGPDVRCKCTFREDAPTCVHVCAVLLFLFRFARGMTFGFPQPSPEVWAEMCAPLLSNTETSLVETKTPSRQSIQKRDTTLTLSAMGGYGGLRVSVSGPIPHSFLRTLGVTLVRTFSRGRDVRSFTIPDPNADLDFFLSKARERGLTVVIDLDDYYGEVSGDLEEIPLCFELENKGNEIVGSVIFLNKGNWMPFGLSNFVYDPSTKRLGTMIPCKGMDYAPPFKEALINNGEEGYLEPDDDISSIFDRAAIPLGDFNRFSARIPIDDDPEILPTLTPEGGTRRDGELTLRIENEEGWIVALPYFEGNGHAVGADFLIAGLEWIFQRVDSRGGLFRSKKKVQNIRDAVTKAFFAEQNEEAKEIIVSLADKEELQLGGFKNELAVLSETICRARDLLGLRHEILVALPTGNWEYWRISFPQLADFLFALCQPEKWNELVELSGGMAAHPDHATEFISRCNQVAARFGVPVQLHGKPVRMETPEIQIYLKAGEDDWFDLDANVTCGSLTIPPEDWTRLMNGEAILTEGEGGWISVSTEKMEAFAALERMRKGKRKGSKETLQVNRLAVFEILELRHSGAKVDIPPEMEQIVESLSNLSQLPDTSLPDGLRADLRDYQKIGYQWIRFLWEHRFGACLADDMGLGKTVQSIAFLQALRESGEIGGERRAAILVVPPSLMYNWASEMARFAPDLKITEYAGSGRNPDVFASADVVLTTYDILRIDIQKLASTEFPVAIFDEAHNLKNPRSARSRAVSKLNRRFSLCLTGTPVENSPVEFYSVLNTAVPGLWRSLDEFRNDYKRSPDTVLLRVRPFLLRRTKKAILKELPDKVESDHYLDMSPAQKEIYTRTVGEVRAEVLAAYAEQEPARAGIKALVALMRLRQVCVSPSLVGVSLKNAPPKVERLLEMLEEVRAEGDSALVFSQFIGALDLVEAATREAKIPSFRLDGRTPRKIRQHRIAAFQEGTEAGVFLISLKAGGVGLNLTKANYVFHLDPWWNPAVENQASDRAHRIGQQRTVFVERLLMKGTVEERMMELKKRKSDLFRMLVGDDGEDQRKGTILNREDFEFLLDG